MNEELKNEHVGSIRITHDEILEIYDGIHWIIFVAPCPFCGSRSYLHENIAPVRHGDWSETKNVYAAACDECGIGQLNWTDKKAALEAWNRRV